MEFFVLHTKRRSYYNYEAARSLWSFWNWIGVTTGNDLDDLGYVGRLYSVAMKKKGKK